MFLVVMPKRTLCIDCIINLYTAFIKKGGAEKGVEKHG